MVHIAFMCMIAIGVPQKAGTPTAVNVIQRCQKAYDAVKTLEVSVKGSLEKMSGTAQISFQRPGKLRVSGKTMFGGTYDMVSDGKSTWVKSVAAWEKRESVDMGIASITGISANAGTAVPALLVHARFSGLPDPKVGKATVAMASLDGRQVYRVRTKESFAPDIWIDPKTYFLLRTEMSAMGKTITVVYGAAKVNQPIPAARFKK